MRDKPSGRNFFEKSKRRPRMTSRSMSQRTRLEVSMHLALARAERVGLRAGFGWCEVHVGRVRPFNGRTVQKQAFRVRSARAACPRPMRFVPLKCEVKC